MPGVEGPGGSACRLDEARLAELRTALEAGPAAHGWAQDQRWTLARAAALVARLFGALTRCAGCRSCCTASATRPRSRSTPGGRARRGRGRRVAGGDLGQGTRLAALTDAWICFEDEARPAAAAG
jgi:hypothetical protein